MTLCRKAKLKLNYKKNYARNTILSHKYTNKLDDYAT